MIKMQHNFKIDLHYDNKDFNIRPKVSYKIKEYIENLFVGELFLKKRIISHSKLSTLLQISFFVNKGKEYIVPLPASVFKRENVKAYPIMVSYSDKFQESKNVNVDFAYFLFDIISEFLLLNFKKIKHHDLEVLKEKMDIDYLSNIIYPAPYKEQRFVGDDSIIGETIYLGYNKLS